MISIFFNFCLKIQWCAWCDLYKKPASRSGFPFGSAGKESACDEGDLRSIPGLGRSPGEGKGYPLQDSGLENSMDYIYSPWGGKVGHNWATFTFHLEKKWWLWCWVLNPVTHHLVILNLCCEKGMASPLGLSQYVWPEELADTPRRSWIHQPK